MMGSTWNPDCTRARLRVMMESIKNVAWLDFVLLFLPPAKYLLSFHRNVHLTSYFACEQSVCIAMW